MRPKTFDPGRALEAAMVQFWESGFEGSSMQDLVDRMGISRQSLYDTYGNKRDLFEAALKRYREDVIDPKIEEVSDPSLPPVEAVRRYLYSIAEGNSETPIGCLVVRTATEIPVRDAEIGRFLDECVSDVHRSLAAVIERGQQLGQFDQTRSAHDLAGTVVAAGMGLHVLRRLPDRGAHVRPSVESVITGLRPAAA